jgi:DNA-binding FadR family transcriptional regulator
MIVRRPAEAWSARGREVLAAMTARNPEAARTHVAGHLARSRELRLAQSAQVAPSEAT